LQKATGEQAMTFKVGQSGNPKGRVKGSVNKRTQLARLLEPHAEELVAKMIQLALGGDVTALRLCIERLIPKVLNEPTGIELPRDFDEKGSSKIKDEVLSMVLDGRMNVADAEKLMRLIDSKYSENGCSMKSSPALPPDPVEAVRIYQKIMMG
jgi:hypothetical protein